MPTVVTVTCSQDFFMEFCGDWFGAMGIHISEWKAKEQQKNHWFDPCRFRMIIPKADLVGGVEHEFYFSIYWEQ